MTADHEVGLLRFLLQLRRQRIAEQLRNPKRRSKALHSLAHLRHLDLRFAHRISHTQQTPIQIAALLEERGAPEDCYIISENPELDAATLPLTEALARIVGSGMGTLVSCLPGRLGYFEGEEPGERYILERATRVV